MIDLFGLVVSFFKPFFFAAAKFKVAAPWFMMFTQSLPILSLGIHPPD
jgi:hypothetical protein